MTFSEKSSHARTTQWAMDISGYRPSNIPVHSLAPANRMFFNVRDFCKQHGATPVYGWAIDRKGPIIKAQFSIVVRYQGKMFSVTKTDLGHGDIWFFEDRKHVPRVSSTDCGCDILHTFYPLVYPETNPAKKIIVIEDPECIELQMDLPASEKRQSVSMSKSYPPVAESNAPLEVVPPSERIAEEPAAVHPFLKKLKKYSFSMGC